ncbi:hypothetical protein Golob_017777 [Gossypium lobatum]|uniref:Aminotransferase-like plant mobile domain-containing protein n=1 Tax=Gossypium lobatum TaxID=34289 RepID=A0A7J8M892_9ROSI|nr:hypothetical protein [Gossypium lobatum]
MIQKVKEKKVESFSRMDASLIRFDNNHISSIQLAMADDRVLEAFIHNMEEPPIPKIRGLAVVPGKVDLYKIMLAKVPNMLKAGWISINWLDKLFNKPHDDPMEEVIHQYVQVFIIRLIGVILMLDKSRNLVHVRWLLYLMDFSKCTKLSWGSPVLSTLYQELCRVTQSDKMSIGGCLLLLL